MRGACESCKCREYTPSEESFSTTMLRQASVGTNGSSVDTLASGTARRRSKATTQRCAMCHHSVMVHLAMDLARARRKARSLSHQRGQTRAAVREGRLKPPMTRFAAMATGESREAKPGAQMHTVGGSLGHVRELEAQAAAAAAQKAAPKKAAHDSLKHEIDVDLFNRMRVKYRNQHCSRYGLHSGSARTPFRMLTPLDVSRNRNLDAAAIAKSLHSTWSPLGEYEASQRKTSKAKSSLTSHPTRRSAPSFTIGRRTPLPKPVVANPAPNHYSVTTAIDKQSKFRSAPAPTMPRSRSAAHRPTPESIGPGPIYDTRERLDKDGFSFGTRLKSPRQISQDLGHPTTPAPGGNTQVCFTMQSAPHAQPVANLSCGWCAMCQVPSFARDNQQGGKGVVFGRKLLSPRSILRRIGYPEPPAPGGNTKVPSFARDNRAQAKGVVFGAKHKHEDDIAMSLGRWSRLGPGGSYRLDRGRLLAIGHTATLTVADACPECLRLRMTTLSAVLACRLGTGYVAKLIWTRHLDDRRHPDRLRIDCRTPGAKWEGERVEHYSGS